MLFFHPSSFFFYYPRRSFYLWYVLCQPFISIISIRFFICWPSSFLFSAFSLLANETSKTDSLYKFLSGYKLVPISSLLNLVTTEITRILWLQLDDLDLGRLWFQQIGATCLPHLPLIVGVLSWTVLTAVLETCSHRAAVI